MNEHPIEQPHPVKNVLFIMCDQLRLDALSCHGGIIDTPNIDALAARGARFDQAYIQGAVCGSSRMSYYTGRYVQSHGARWNQIPLAIGQRTIGDHVRPLGVRPALVGKTHMAPDLHGLEWLGLDPESPEAIYLAECGFEPAERDDGLHPDIRRAGAPELPYNRFLREHGYQGANPWHSAANAVIDDSGKVVSGWLLRASPYPTVVPDELSETAYMTDRAIDFMARAGDERWCLHLSFIKPHWPYVVSEPYHRLVHPNDLPSPNRTDAERVDEHPVLAAMRNSRVGRTFSRDEVRRAVYPAYLGLVKQIDDHLGRLFAAMDESGRSDDTMIVFTSDHGDYMGDHWMGEKDWFHDPIVNVPMIVVDPRPEADATRGQAITTPIETIDLAPTFVESLGGGLDPLTPWLEGTSLVPLLHGVEQDRPQVVSETDFGPLELGDPFPGQPQRSQRATMIYDGRYKYILSEVGPNLLYDLESDPDELVDRIDDPTLGAVRDELHERLFAWYRDRSNEVTRNPAHWDHARPDGDTARRGIFIGYWDEAAAAADGVGHHLAVTSPEA